MPIELKLRHRNCKMHLLLEHKITVIVGLSATGKSTLHRVLTDKDATTQYKLSDGRYQIEYIADRQSANNFIDNHRVFKSYRIYLIDEGKLEIDNEIAYAIQHSSSAYFVITSRTSLGKLNFDIHAVKELKTQSNGVTILTDYIVMKQRNYSALEAASICSVIVEDSGKAKQWFIKLFEKVNLKVDSPDKMGKEQVCLTVAKKLDTVNEMVFALFDVCSFGCCVKELKGLAESYGNRVLILSNYKSWEYMMLQSNMYKDLFTEYTIEVPQFEEGYYEELLADLSKQNRYTMLNHDSKSALSRCYTEPCCPYIKAKNTACNLGLVGEDKFTAMFKDTAFENLLIIARRI